MFLNTLIWIVKNRRIKNKSIICDGSYITVNPGIVWLAKLLKVKIIAIIADIYDYMSVGIQKEGKKTIIKNILARFGEYCFKNYNGYILLTEEMNKIVNHKNVPYIIMEGLVDKKSSEGSKDVAKYENFVVMYAGGLCEKYGVKYLIDGIIEAKTQGLELWLYGSGDLEHYIKELNNEKIKYFGVVDNEKIIEEEAKVTLLVNPRFTNEEYTKYSFPSKNMEYMVSGTPLLTTKLPGMPEEYKDYVYLIEDETIENISEQIEKLSKMNRKTLEEKGIKAREFVIKNKNNVIQANRILELIESINM